MILNNNDKFLVVSQIVMFLFVQKSITIGAHGASEKNN